MRKIRLVIVETSIEKVPKELHKHPAIEKDAKRRKRSPNKILLYLPVHYTALASKGIPFEKRGRPDILHRLLLTILDHPLNKMNLLELYFHTTNNEIFWVNPETRPPIHFYGFEGLMIQLLEKGRVPPEGETILMKKVDKTLEEVLKEGNREVYALEKGGRDLSEMDIKNIYGNTVIVGGFQKGDYREDIQSLIDHRISLTQHTLKASTAACMALTILYQHALP